MQSRIKADMLPGFIKLRNWVTVFCVLSVINLAIGIVLMIVCAILNESTYAIVKETEVYIIEPLASLKPLEKFVRIGVPRYTYEAGELSVKGMLLVRMFVYECRAFFIVYILAKVKVILKSSIQQETPFIIENADLIRKIGVIYLIYTIGLRFFSSTDIDSIESVVSVFMSFLPGVVIMILSKIFLYGCHLQQEYDETI